MKKTTMFKAFLAVLLCLAMVLPFIPVTAEAEAVNHFDVSCFEGKKVSIIGDSISTFEGVNNDTYYNATIGSNETYYGNTANANYASFADIRWEDTWWQQVIDVLDMELCVNNSWSGSYILKDEASAGWKDQRVTNLHDRRDEMPDIIFMYLGTNDCAALENTDTMGNTASATAMTATSTPTKILDAYSVMIQKAKKSYPDAEIYCFTLLPHKGYHMPANQAAVEAFNAGVTQLAAQYGCKLVDLYNDCGISHQRISLDATMLDNVHPNGLGMDAITNCVISSMVENSKYAASLPETYTVSYDLLDSYVEVGNVVDGEVFFGDVTRAMKDQPFTVKLDTVGISNLDVTVTMGGQDITDQVVTGNYIEIPKVTGKIVISAGNTAKNYYLVTGATGYTSNPDQSVEFTHNGVAQLAGTHVSGVYSDADDGRYRLSHSIVLRHDRPWVLEFKMGGGTHAGGVLPFSDTAASSTVGNTYIHTNQTQFLLGFRNRIGYCNSGVNWTTIATKLGSSAGQEIRKEMLTFKLENRVAADGTNMPYLYVNGIEIGAMDQAKSDDWVDITGVDFVFNYIGTSNHPLQNAALEYVKAYENGVGGVAEDEVHNFRWAGIGENMTSAKSDGFFTENPLEQEMGNGDNGSHVDNTYYSLNQPINLYHDRAWTLEFRARGGWGAGTGEDPMFLSSCNDSNRLGITYLWRNSTDYIALGTRIEGEAGYQNYGVDMSTLGLSDQEYYTYRLENQITYDANGRYKSNMVWLYIDGEAIAPMTRHRDNGNDTNPVSTGDWISGKDFRFNFIGNKNFPLNGVTFDYIQVWEDGGSVNTLRLEYLINTARDDNGSFTNTQSYTANTWSNYVNSLNAGIALLKDPTINQTRVDKAVDTILSTRNALVSAASATKIYSVEPISGGKAVIGMQCAVKVITSPNVAQVCVGSQSLIVNSSEVQELILDGAATRVKVWMLSWKRSAATEQSVTYDVGAWKTYSDSHDGLSTSNPDAHTTVTLTVSNKLVVGAAIKTQPAKTAYQAGERFDATGLVLTVSYRDSDGTVSTKDVSAIESFSWDTNKLTAGTQSVAVTFGGATVQVLITVS